MYQYPYIENFYKENYSKLLDRNSPLRPSKSCPKNGAAAADKFKEFFQKSKVRSFTEEDLLTILSAENIKDGDTIFHQNLRMMRELGFVTYSKERDKKYFFTESFFSFVESNHSVGYYIIEKLMSISSVDDLTMYFNFLICVMREAAIYGQVVLYPDAANKFEKVVPDKQKQKEHQERVYLVYGFKGDEARLVPENYTPNVSYFCHAALKQLGILTKSETKIDNMGTLVLTPFGEIILKKIDENLAGDNITPKKEIKVPSLNFLTNLNLQQIYYGAPGTGKSYAINKKTEGMGDNVIRTTFHPDSDYSTFVGAYKPTKQVVKLRDSSGHVIKDYNEETGRTEEVTEDRIVYKFVAQAFVRAYTRAWRNFAEAPEGEQPQPVFLVIEEINRGNCAQIFGDLFQLLDRNDKGFSDYPIVADSDMRGYLFGAMSDARAKLTADRCADINALYKRDVMADVLSGNALMLPSNLCIWATMNTSDQSLFPIDSAFKRRWDWKYVPICKPANKNWKLQVGGTYYDWWSFLEKANDVIDSLTKSEDKKLGYFFCKADEETGIISEERFVGKVLFYLWNDVFKDYGLSGDQFKGTDGQPLVFANFYYVDVNGDTKENTPNVQKFLENLGVETAGEADDYNPAPANVEEGEDTNATDSERRETEIKRKEYWSAWLDYAQSHSEEYKMYFSGRKTPSFDHWYSYYIGRKGCHISVCQIRRRNEINLELSFDETNDDYLKLRTYQEEMEQELGFELVCQDKPAKKQCSIEEKHPMAPVNFENKDEWETQFAHILDRLLSMRRVFLKYLDMPKK